MSEPRIAVTYRARVAAAEANELARAIAYEQTVELPPEQVTDRYVLDAVVGRVEEVAPDPAQEGYSHIRISHETGMANGQLNQLLNLVFGNVSIYPGVRLARLELPASLLDSFGGPAHGIEGIRRLTGVQGRPLLATAVKPRGLPVEDLAAMAHDFALGGGDLVKDDQNLVDDFERFKHRVLLTADAVDAANQKTGRRCLYLPHVSAAAEDLPRCLDLVEALGLPGVLICPLIVGLDQSRALVSERGLLCMAHPAMSGTFTNSIDGGIAHDVYLGTLMRLIGADISIFPNWGGRFSFPESTCSEIARALRAPLAGLAPAMPCPAGGMNLGRVRDMCAHYGPDSMLLVGGALLGHPEGVVQGARAFREAILEQMAETVCDPVPAGARRPAVNLYRALDDFHWEGRESSPYKDAGDLAFKGVRRVELAGRFGERTAFDLRYFEVAPGGYSSHEKHLHAHVVIGARGQGQLILGNERVALNRDDVAYIEPLQAHQLRNESAAPFGFYCIVDHRRDRPMKP